MIKKLYVLAIGLLMAVGLQAQTVIKGNISAQDGGALPSATVMEKGTNNGTVADLDGNFSITLIKTPATLVFTFVGYTTQEIEVSA